MRRSVLCLLSRRGVAALLCAWLAAPVCAQTGGPYRITNSVFPGGGGASAQGSTRVEGTIGQGSAGEASGGVYTVSGGFQPAAAAALSLTVSDVTKAEGASGTTAFNFTVSLDSPAPAGGVGFNASTADGPSDPAGSGSDYAALSDQPGSIPEGQTSTTVTVQVNGDAAQEPDETFTVTVSSVTGAEVVDGSGVGTILNDDGAPAAGRVVISEFRLRGPGADADAQANNEFVEIYNATGSPLVVVDSAPAAADRRGWAIVSSDAPLTPKYVIPAGTVIPARGHFLVTNILGYSLSARAAADAPGGVPATYALDIPDGAGLALFRTGTPLAGSEAAGDILDRVGFKVTGAPFAEGPGLEPQGGVTAPLEHSFFRRQCDFVPAVGCRAGGDPKDSDDNAADFLFADTQGTSDAAGRRLGTPGPENTASPVRRDTDGVIAPLLDGTKSSGVAPNRARDQTSDPANNSTFGTLAIRRRVANHTGADVTRLRFRIIELTTFPAEEGNADLRARTSGAVTVMSVNDATTCSPASPPCSVNVLGTTLEEPPSQPNGGGYNSTLSAGTVTLATPLADGASVNVQFLLGVEQAGKFRFYIVIEALP